VLTPRPRASALLATQRYEADVAAGEVDYKGLRAMKGFLESEWCAYGETKLQKASFGDSSE
jgi:hypothetical protein